MKKIILIVSISICLFSCKQNGANVETIYMRTSETENISNLFNHVSIIDLEITDMSLVGLYISNIIIWDNKIFIQNELQSRVNILCFGLDGKFLFKIDKMGQGPGEYSHLSSFFIDKKQNHLVLVNENKQFAHFDLSGNFLYNVYATDLYTAAQILYLNDSTCIAYNDATFLPKPKMSLLDINPATMNIRNQSNSINEFFFCSGNKPLSAYNDNILCLAFNDTIYDISSGINNAKPKYLVYYSDEQITTKNVIRKNVLEMDYMKQVKMNHSLYTKGESMWVSAMYENNIYLVLSCKKYVPDKDLSESYILFYNKGTKKLYNSDNINFDNYSLRNCSVCGIDGDTFYCVLYSEITAEDKIKIKNSSVFSEEDKKKLLAHKDDDNPLILVLK